MDPNHTRNSVYFLMHFLYNVDVLLEYFCDVLKSTQNHGKHNTVGGYCEV